MPIELPFPQWLVAVEVAHEERLALEVRYAAGDQTAGAVLQRNAEKRAVLISEDFGPKEHPAYDPKKTQSHMRALGDLYCAGRRVEAAEQAAAEHNYPDLTDPEGDTDD